LFNRERGHAIGEVCSEGWIIVLVEVGEEGGGEDISGTGWINLLSRVGGKAGSFTLLEEGSAVATVSGNEERDEHTPACKNGIGRAAFAIGEG
jgi:hypothetical protein